MTITIRILSLLCLFFTLKASANRRQIYTFETNSVLDGGSCTTNVGYYYHQDSLTSSSALSGSSGAQTEVNVWFPFGRIQTASPQASFQVSRRFTGQVFDAESGLYYYNARYYDPELGRFIQPDTVISDLWNPQSYNRYSYVANDPLTYNDPSGHQFFTGQAFMGPQSADFEHGVQQGTRVAAAAGVGSVVAIGTGGAATPILVNLGASSTVAAVGGGMVAGATGDVASQATQVALGARKSISGQEVAVSTLVGGALNGVGSKLVSSGAATTGVQANKAAGEAWESEVINNQLPKTQNNIQPQITIKSSGPSGKNVRLDAVGTDSTTGNIRLTDAKASATAPFTPNQTIVYPELQQYGGTVTGAGKPPYTGGTVIPPTKVDVVRKP